MLKIYNDKIYGLDESLIASGYPMKAHEIAEWDDDTCISEKDMKRGKILGGVDTGTGHDSYLKGVIVQFDITYPNYWTPQFQRYHFADIISSTSKMHRLTKMDIKKSCNKYVEDIVIDNLNYWIEKFNSIGGEETLTVNDISYTKHELYMKIISNCPMGLEQTMRVTTNYLQLKTIYQQRKNHKLEEWHVFCAWCETLDRFVELCLKNKRLFTNDKGEIISDKLNWKI